VKSCDHVECCRANLPLQRSSLDAKVSTVTSGRAAEDLSAQWLQEHGFTVLDRHFTFRKVGELDIVAREGDVLVFVEVRSSNSDRNPTPEMTIGWKKQVRVRRSAEAWMRLKNMEGLPCRCDVIAVVTIGGQTTIRHYPNAF
jgi:putative endonuclease